MDAEEQSPAHKEDITGSQVKFWVLGYGVTSVRRWDVGVDERRIPGPFGRCRGSRWAEVRAVYPSFRMEEENVLDEIRSFSLYETEILGSLTPSFFDNSGEMLP